MADQFTLRQADVVAKLSNVVYGPDEGFQDANTWHVADAAISAHSDTKLNNGPAIIEHEGKEFPIAVSVLDFDEAEEDDAEDDDKGWQNPACEIEIGYAEGLKKLAEELGLIRHRRNQNR